MILRSILFLVIFLYPLTAISSSEPVLIGLNVPLTGAYAKQGTDQLKAYQLAINILNQKGGILGRKIVYSVKDTQTNADIARKNAREFIAEKAIMITGGSSSSVAIAQSEECQKAGVIFMAALTHSNDTTGADGHRNTFRWYMTAHQTAKAMARTLIEKFGSEAKYAFLYADYTWGRTTQQSMAEVVTKAGGTVVLKLPTKLGTKSFIPFLLKAKQAKPDVLVLVHFGQDMISCLKQVTRLKLRNKMAVVVPLMEINMARPLGPEIMQGVITTMTWYHELANQFAGSRNFVDLFEGQYEQKPGSSAAVAWVNIFQYADAVERAQSFNNEDVIKALEGHKFTLLGEEESWRSWDHQGIHPIYVAIGKTPAESKSHSDLFKIISSKNGKDMARTRLENPVQLEPLGKR